MVHPIECSDEYGLEGVKDAEDFIRWFNSWLQDPDVTECNIRKVGGFSTTPVSNYIIKLPTD